MIPPALSPEEWKQIRETGCLDCYTHDKKISIDEFTEPEDISRHGLGALCFDGQSFGFTREDVHMARCLQNNWTIDFDKLERWAESMANRLEAILPPEVT